MLTGESNGLLKGSSYSLHAVRDLLQGPSFLNVSREHGDHSTRTRDGDGKPDDAPKWRARTILLPHRDQREDDADYAQEYNEPQG